MILLVCNLPTPGVQFSRSVVSDSLWPHGLQQARSPCPSPIPRACSNSHQSSQSCHPTISSSVVPFSSHLPIFPSIRVFSNESILHTRWPKDWSFSFSISPSGLISFWIDKTWPTREGNGKPLQYSCLENPMWKSFRHVWLSVTPWLSSPWNSPGQNAGVGNLSRELHQGSSLIFICGIPLCGIKIELFILLFILFFKFYFFWSFLYLFPFYILFKRYLSYLYYFLTNFQ